MTLTHIIQSDNKEIEVTADYNHKDKTFEVKEIEAKEFYGSKVDLVDITWMYDTLPWFAKGINDIDWQAEYQMWVEANEYEAA